MSFIYNVTQNDTMKYWSKKLKNKWYRLLFLLTKNIEIDIFLKNHLVQPNLQHKDIIFKLCDNNYKNNLADKDKNSVVVVVPFFIKDDLGVKQLLNLLKSLERQILKPKAIILIDDGSSIKYKIPQRDNLNVIKLQNNNGPAYARNVGIEKAITKYNAKIIAFTDSDVIVSNEWVENIFNGFKNNPQAAALSGHTYSFGHTWFDKYHNINGTLNGRVFKDTNMLLYAPSCNLAIISDCLKNIQFDCDFPLSAGEDIHFCFQFLQKKLPIIYHKEMIVHHDFGYSRFRFIKNYIKFKKLFIKYAKGENILLRKIPNYYSYLELTREISNM